MTDNQLVALVFWTVWIFCICILIGLWYLISKEDKNDIFFIDESPKDWRDREKGH